MHRLFSCLIMLTITGCSSLNFNESKLALAKNQAVAGVLFGKKVDMIAAGASAESVLDKLKKSSVSSRYNEFKSGCVERGHELMVAPEVVPVVAAFVKLVFGIFIEFVGTIFQKIIYFS